MLTGIAVAECAGVQTIVLSVAAARVRSVKDNDILAEKCHKNFNIILRRTKVA